MSTCPVAERPEDRDNSNFSLSNRPTGTWRMTDDNLCVSQSLERTLIGCTGQMRSTEDSGRAAHSPAGPQSPGLPLPWSGVRGDLARLWRPVIQPNAHLGVASKVSVWEMWPRATVRWPYGADPGGCGWAPPNQVKASRAKGGFPRGGHPAPEGNTRSRLSFLLALWIFRLAGPHSGTRQPPEVNPVCINTLFAFWFFYIFCLTGCVSLGTPRCWVGAGALSSLS